MEFFVAFGAVLVVGCGAIFAATRRKPLLRSRAVQLSDELVRSGARVAPVQEDVACDPALGR